MAIGSVIEAARAQVQIFQDEVFFLQIKAIHAIYARIDQKKIILMAFINFALDKGKHFEMAQNLL